MEIPTSSENTKSKNSENTLKEYAEHIAKAAPRLLWHYTSAEGLLGILEQGALRATGVDYLNDKTEGTYLTEMMLGKIKNKVPKNEFQIFKYIFSPHCRRVKEMGVVCFCGSDDLLSIWRAYTSGKGFAIGFDSKKLARYWVEEKYEGLLSPVKYSESKALELAEHHATVVVDAWRSLLPQGMKEFSSFNKNLKEPLDEDVEKLAQILPEFFKKTGYLMMSGAFQKNKHFHEEREWRLVTDLLGGRELDRPRIETSVNKNGLSLFRPIPFQDTPQDTPIREIMMGPGLDEYSQKKAIFFTLQNLGYPTIKISNSDVPIRL